MRSSKKSENTHRLKTEVNPMRLISADDLLHRLRAEAEKYKNGKGPTDMAIWAGLQRAITEVVLSPTEGRKK